MQTQPSPVLMLRSVPQGSTEKDLENWANQYTYTDATGHQKCTRCVKALLLSDRNIGFVQFQDVQEAMFLMNKFNESPQEIQMRRPDGSLEGLNLLYSDKQEIRAQGRARNQIPTSQTRILLVVLKELSATIMMDELFWIFSQFGTVEKLSSFTKNMRNQVLVQYQTQEHASLAMSYLNGRQITFAISTADPSGQQGQQGSCQFAIVPSKLPELTFKNQDQKNRDYNNLNEILRGIFLESRQGRIEMRPALKTMSEQHSYRIRDFLWGVWVLGDGYLDPRQDRAHQGQIPVDPSKARSTGIPEGRVGECVHIAGIPPHPKDEKTEEVHPDPLRAPPPGGFTPRMLWRLLGMHGSIVAVKLLYKYPGCAIVQYKDAASAHKVIEHFDGLQVFGKRFEVKESKNANAMHWSGAKTELQERMCTVVDEGVTPPEVPQAVNFARPNESLSVWGLPDEATEGELREIFARVVPQHRGPVAIRLERGRATVQFPNTDCAVLAAAYTNGELVRIGGVDVTLNVHFDKKRARPAGPAGVEGIQGGMVAPHAGAADDEVQHLGAKTPGVTTHGEGFMDKTWTC
eukprot:TRINITY_DN3371_c0_g1_i2.p1 TRINITY_DN3371_c0_g1~~TRINITY_DN3371_c0_g1_i2.p1  ORF type:complete len:574 (+),score=179.78 TRINITY_DN3371_c0_g1_i2:355-2076(+)